MEFPVIIPDSDDQNTHYTIKTRDLSYRLCRRHSYLNWASCLIGENKDRSGSDTYIIKNVNCEAKPGEITALTGPSGAGKTTLLEILAGVNLPQGETSGHVLVNNKPMNSSSFRKASGYVSQDEALFPLLTVEETLMFSARLRMQGGDLNRPAAKVHELQGDDLNHRATVVHELQCGDLNRPAARVRVLLKELGLEHVANLRIGDESTRGISGGEKRRVSIGVELVHDPAVLLLDEPTSGLDSASALHLALLLKSMAVNQRKTIVITIHQPGFRILEQFDQVLLLFNGTIRHHGSLQKLEERLKIAGHEIPARVNVLEFAIDVAGSMHVDTKENDISLVEEQQFEFFKEHDFSYPNSHIGEIVILGQRFSKNIFRTKQLFAARIIQAILAGFVLGTIFMNAMNAPNKKFKLQTQIGFFAFSLTFLLSSTTEGLPIFLQERRILMRETSRGAYRISSYVLSNTFIFLPFLLLVTLLFVTPVYWLVGLRKDYDGFLYFSLVVWMTILMSNSLVASFSALVPNFIMGTSLIAGINGSFFLFSGYFISKDDIPWYWIFMHYLSLFKYPFECFLINEFGGENGKDRCVQSVGEECLLNGDMFLRQQGLMESQKWSNLWVMFGFIFGYRFLCFLILWFRSCRTRA